MARQKSMGKEKAPAARLKAMGKEKAPAACHRHRHRHLALQLQLVRSWEVPPMY